MWDNWSCTEAAQTSKAQRKIADSVYIGKFFMAFATLSGALFYEKKWQLGLMFHLIKFCESADYGYRKIPSDFPLFTFRGRSKTPP